MVKKVIFDVLSLLTVTVIGVEPMALPSLIRRRGHSVRPIRALEMRPMSLQKTSR